MSAEKTVQGKDWQDRRMSLPLTDKSINLMELEI